MPVWPWAVWASTAVLRPDHEDTGTFGGEGVRGRPADSRTAPGDHHCPALEQALCWLSHGCTSSLGCAGRAGGVFPRNGPRACQYS
ncbi:hypothetical protein GCM10017690_33490 [Microbacterium terregens]